MPRTWIGSNGGPLLLLPVAHLSAWHGTDRVDGTRNLPAHSQETDYDRACAVADYTGVIPVGAAEGLVLGDEPNDTTWLPLPRGGILARWVYAPGEEQATAALASIPPDTAWEPAGVLRVSDSPLELFDSAESGENAVGERLRIDIPAGVYEVARADHRPDVETWFQLVRLHPTIEAPS